MIRRYLLAASGLLILFAASPVHARPPGRDPRDPKIEKLAKSAQACPFEDGSFSDECAAFKAWVDNEELFRDGHGDGTIFTMMESADLKVRVLATSRGFSDADAVFADKANVMRLFALAQKETDPGVASSLSSYVAVIDAEKLGMSEAMSVLAKHPLAKFRAGLAFHLYARWQTPLNLELTKALLRDSDREVRLSALTGLSMGAQRGKKEESCRLLGQQLARTDDVAADAHWRAATSDCRSIYDALADSISRRLLDPAASEKDGVTYALAIGAMCKNATALQKQKGFLAAQKLVASTVKNPNARSAGIEPLLSCDPVAGKPLVGQLAKDRDKLVAERAAKELARRM